MLIHSLASTALALLSPVLATSHTAPDHIISKRCVNSAADRSCWGDYDLSTDYYDTIPDTGVVREYWFELVNTTAAPDGFERMVLTVNGTIPGPTIIADWGDTVVVHVTNGLQNNGTGIHFHGVRQNMTNANDGVPSITQCAVAPGDSITYQWRASQYGSSWYHSHFVLQAWNGVFGGIVINGPATANYDIDAGNLFLNDWTHDTIDDVYLVAETSGPPTLDNGLINGTNVWNDQGYRFNMTFEPGKSYRLRLVNAAVDTMFKFMIDSHQLTVIATDFVPIVPYTTNVLSIAIGQRYDVIVTANQTIGDYWMRAIPQVACSDNAQTDNIRGIIRYDPTSTDDPTTSAYAFKDACEDEALTNLVPRVALDVGNHAIQENEPVTVGQVGNVFKWYMDAVTFLVDWGHPTILNVYENNTNASFKTQEHVIRVDNPNEWVYFVIQTTLAVPHPIHLHGHDFWVIAQGSGVYNEGNTTINQKNPPRRDTALLPASGYLVIAFPSDNPGIWLMHCHIAFHASEGLALQIVERISEIPAVVDKDCVNNSTRIEKTCANWANYQTSQGVIQDDSGI